MRHAAMCPESLWVLHRRPPSLKVPKWAYRAESSHEARTSVSRSALFAMFSWGAVHKPDGAATTVVQEPFLSAPSAVRPTHPSDGLSASLCCSYRARSTINIASPPNYPCHRNKGENQRTEVPRNNASRYPLRRHAAGRFRCRGR